MRQIQWTPERRQELWRRRRTGEPIPNIAQAIGCCSFSVHKELSKTGGIEPPKRKRSPQHLTMLEREEVSRGLAVGESMASIARRLGRPTSTVSREVKRHGGCSSYRAQQADQRAQQNARRPKQRRLESNPVLREQVFALLRHRWAPQQIAGWLKVEFPHDSNMHISHEAIYRTLYVQARGALKKELVGHLRKRHAIRRPNKNQAATPGTYAIPDMVMISERPPEAADRAVPGHWEGDLLAGSNNSHIITLVERRSRYVILIKTASKSTSDVVAALIEHVQRLPAGMMTTLTWDQGREMASHVRFTVATDVNVYFCDPRSPWQRGSNENTNGLLRQYFPKGTDLSKFTQGQLDYVSAEMNTRPRQTLGWKFPVHVLLAALQ